MSNNLRYRGMWLANRIDKLPENCDTACVRQHLALGEKTVRRWLADPYFKANGVAEQIDGHWIWHKELLKEWLIAIGTLVLPKVKGELSDNPPVSTRDEIRKSMGIPEGYTIE